MEEEDAKRWAAQGHLVVRMQDSREGGNCAAGTLAFAHAHNLGQACTVRQLLALHALTTDEGRKTQIGRAIRGRMARRAQTVERLRQRHPALAAKLAEV